MFRLRKRGSEGNSDYSPCFEDITSALKATKNQPSKIVDKSAKAVKIAKKFKKEVILPSASELDKKASKDPSYLPWEAAPTFIKTNLMDQFRSPDKRQKRLADAFFDKSRGTAEEVARHIIRAVKKNRFYVIIQAEGKFIWIVKRLFPETYFRIVS